MEYKKMIITRKIQLLVDTNDKEVLKQFKDQLYSWQRICFKSANMIMSHQFVQEQVKDFYYLIDEIKLKLADEKKDEMGMLNTSRMNTTYSLLSKHFKGKIPTNILSNLNNMLISDFYKELPVYWKGERSLRNYKRNIPLPFGGHSIVQLAYTADKRNFSFKLFQIPFRTYLGGDRSDKKKIMERVLAGTLKLRTSSIQLDKGKIFLLACIEIEKEQHQLDVAVIAEACLSIEHPVTVKIGDRELAIGSKEEFLHRRLAIQSAIVRLKKAVAFDRGGHGKTRKLKSLESYRHQEKKYVEHKLHLYSRRLIDFCVKHDAATLILINQELKEEIAKSDPFLLRNWSYYSLKEKIAYKAERAGIQLVVE